MSEYSAEAKQLAEQLRAKALRNIARLERQQQARASTSKPAGRPSAGKSLPR